MREMAKIGPLKRTVMRGCCSRGEARLAIMGSCPCGTTPRHVQAQRGLPGLLHRDLLSPRAHECGGPRVACVALERIALEEGPSTTNTDRLLGDRDHRALHGDVRRPGALDCLQRSIDLGL